MSPVVRRNQLSTLDDQLLMEQVGAGRVDALTELYDRYCVRAYRVAVSVCRDDRRAQDAVQEAFVQIWKCRASYRPPQDGTVAAWLLISVRDRASELIARDEHHPGRWAGGDPHGTSPTQEQVAAETSRRQEAERLLDILAGLPDAQQEVIVLAYYGQLSHTEIAAQLDLPTDTVKGRMRDGLQLLRSTLEQQHA